MLGNFFKEKWEPTDVMIGLLKDLKTTQCITVKYIHHDNVGIELSISTIEYILCWIVGSFPGFEELSFG